MAKTLNVKVLGRLLGTASGFELPDDCQLQFYDFTPAEGLEGLQPCRFLLVDFDSGMLQMCYDIEGTDDSPEMDMVKLLQNVPRYEEPEDDLEIEDEDDGEENLDD